MATSPVRTPPPPPHSTGAQTSPVVTNAFPLQSSVDDDTTVRSKIVFSLKIYEKLNEKNSLVWCQQVEPYVNANNLDEYLVAPISATRCYCPGFNLLFPVKSWCVLLVLCMCINSRTSLWPIFKSGCLQRPDNFVLNCALPRLIIVRYKSISLVLAIL